MAKVLVSLPQKGFQSWYGLSGSLVSLVFADQETRRWPPCLHWECFGISGSMEQEEQQSCEESEAGLVSEAAEHWPHSPLCQSLAPFTDERPAIFRAFAHVLGVCLSHIFSSPSPLYSSFTDDSLSYSGPTILDLSPQHTHKGLTHMASDSFCS